MLTITANDQTKTYGSVNPTLTVGYSGFVGEDLLDVLPDDTGDGEGGVPDLDDADPGLEGVELPLRSDPFAALLLMPKPALLPPGGSA